MRKARHELKYYINYFDYLTLKGKIKNVISPDINSNGEGSYEVISLYFDDIYNSAYQEKVQGTNNRQKFRIRNYNFNDALIKLEKKKKADGFSLKGTKDITREQYGKILSGNVDFLLTTGFEEFIELHQGIKRRFMKPKVVVRYTREAYVHEAGNIRITFDKNIRTGSPANDIFDPSETYTIPESNLIVLEIKYDEFFPSYLKNLVQSNGRLKSSASKYVIGRKYSHLY